MRFRCSICTDEARRLFVAEHIHLGESSYRIEKSARLPDAQDRGVRPMKYETILRHVKHMNQRPMAAMGDGTPLVMEAVPTSVAPKPPKVVTEFTPGGPVDVAAIVQRKVATGLEKGELPVTTAHGLQAQKMIDTREDKRKDRELAVNIARLLSGSMGIPKRLIVKDVTPQDVPDDYVPSLPTLSSQESQEHMDPS
jgi:hypothetical protein